MIQYGSSRDKKFETSNENRLQLPEYTKIDSYTITFAFIIADCNIQPNEKK